MYRNNARIPAGMQPVYSTNLFQVYILLLLLRNSNGLVVCLIEFNQSQISPILSGIGVVEYVDSFTVDETHNTNSMQDHHASFINKTFPTVGADTGSALQMNRVLFSSSSSAHGLAVLDKLCSKLPCRRPDLKQRWKSHVNEIKT